MAAYKVTMIFNMGENGWTESFYWSTENNVFWSGEPVVIGPDGFAQIPALLPWYAAFVARVNILSVQARMVAVRFSNVQERRRSFLDESTAQIAPQTLRVRDVKRRALVCSAVAGEAGSYRRELTLRGIPDSLALVTFNGRSQLDRIAGPFKVYADALIKAEARMSALQKNIGATPSVPLTVSAIEAIGGPPRFIITTAVPHNLSLGSVMRLSKIRTVDAPTPPPLNGVWEAIPYADDDHSPFFSFEILLPFKFAYDGFRYIGGGIMQPRVQLLQRITAITPDRFSSHRTGAAFFAGRGRSRRRVRRR